MPSPNSQPRCYLSWKCAHYGESGHVESNSCTGCQFLLVHLIATSYHISRSTASLHNHWKRTWWNYLAEKATTTGHNPQRLSRHVTLCCFWLNKRTGILLTKLYNNKSHFWGPSNPWTLQYLPASGPRSFVIHSLSLSGQESLLLSTDGNCQYLNYCTYQELTMA